jgi:UrcA family protein
MHKNLRFALLTALALVGGTANANGYLEPKSRTVSLADLNLTSIAGVRAAYGRINQAAETVCQNLDPRNLSQRRHWQNCKSDAIQTAIAKVNAPALTAYAEKRRKGGEPVTVAAAGR